MPIERGHLERMIEGDQRQAIPPFCLSCGYNLTGAVSDRCPECGAYFVRKEWAQKVAAIRQRTQDLHEALTWSRHGLKLGTAGLALLLVGLALEGSCVIAVVRVFGFVAGFVSTFLGLSVFRIEGLPAALPEELAPPRKHAIPVATIVLGLVDAGLAIVGPY